MTEEDLTDEEYEEVIETRQIVRLIFKKINGKKTHVVLPALEIILSMIIINMKDPTNIMKEAKELMEHFEKNVLLNVKDMHEAKKADE